MRKTVFKKPSIISLELNNKCDLNCIFCQRSFNFRELPKKYLTKILEEIKKLSFIIGIMLSGGDPLIYPYLEDVFKFCKKNKINLGCDLHVSSSTFSLWKKFQSNFSLVRVRLFSLRPHKHDFIVGSNGHHEKVGKFVESYNSTSARRHSKVIVMPILKNNLNEVNTVCKFAINNSWKFNPFPYLRLSKNFRLSKKEFLTLCQNVSVLKKNFGKMVENEIQTCWHYPSLKNFCVAGRMLIHIDKLGNVYPCKHTLWSVGNISKDSLSTLWKKCGKIWEKSECFNCKLWKECMGGCLGNRTKIEEKDRSCPHDGL